MKRWIKWIVLLIVLVFVVGLVVGYQQMLPTFHVATGYTAKAICSNHFLTGQDVDTIAAELPSNPLVPFLRTKVDEDERFVSVTLVGLAGQRAVYREGLGCTLLAGGGGEGAKTQISDLIQPSALDPNTPWPAGEAVSLDDLPPDVDGRTPECRVWMIGFLNRTRPNLVAPAQLSLSRMVRLSPSVMRQDFRRTHLCWAGR